MFTTEELKNRYHRLCDYDEIGDLETEVFTKNLDKIEFLTENHPFLVYLDAFLHGLEYPTILHGYYKKDNYNLKLFIDDTSAVSKSSIPGNKRPIHPNCKTGIWVAWNKYVERFTPGFPDECRVSLYDRYCGELYEMNDYEHDSKEFYKWFVGGLVDDKF